MQFDEGLPPRNDVLGIISLVLGIISVLCAAVSLVFAFVGACCCLGQIGVLIGGGLGLLLASVGLVLGIVSLVRIKKNPDELGGRGFGIAGVILNALALLGNLAPIILGIAMYAGFLALGATDALMNSGY